MHSVDKDLFDKYMHQLWLIRKMRGKQYKNKLDAKSAAKGIQLAKENAKTLLNDAELLFENDRFERSVSLAICLLKNLENQV